MKDTLVAERYARAFFEFSAARRLDQKVEDEFQSLAEVFADSGSIAKFFENPGLKPSEKKRLFEKVYGGRRDEVSALMIGFVSLLIDKGRLGMLPEVAAVYKRIADSAQGEAIAQVSSAVAIDAASEKLLLERLERILGQKVLIRKELDRSLIGGMQVRIGHKVLDGSVRSRIGRIKKELMATNKG